MARLLSKDAVGVLHSIGYSEDLNACSDDELIALEDKVGDMLDDYVVSTEDPKPSVYEPYYEILNYLANDVD